MSFFERKLVVDNKSVKRNIRYRIAQQKSDVCEFYYKGTIYEMDYIQGH